MKNLIFLILFLPVLSCKPQPSEKEQKAILETRVMDVHDVAMADMDRIYRLRKEISQLRDSLSSRQADSLTLSHLSRQVVLLEQADEAMMDWMRRYKAPPETQAHEATMQYLVEELHKIEQVKIQIDTTIQASEKIIAKYENDK